MRQVLADFLQRRAQAGFVELANQSQTVAERIAEMTDRAPPEAEARFLHQDQRQAQAKVFALPGEQDVQALIGL